MCVECLDAMQSELQLRGWEPTDNEIMDFLWSCTCFPFAHPAEKIREAFTQFGTLPTFQEFFSAAAAYAEEEMSAAMHDLHEAEAAQTP